MMRRKGALLLTAAALTLGFAWFIRRFRIDYSFQLPYPVEALPEEYLPLWARTTSLLDTVPTTFADDAFPPRILRWNRGHFEIDTSRDGIFLLLKMKGWPSLRAEVTPGDGRLQWRWMSLSGTWRQQWHLWRHASELKTLLRTFSREIVRPATDSFLAWKAMAQPALTEFQPTTLLGVRTLIPRPQWLSWARRSYQIAATEAQRTALALDRDPFLYWFDTDPDTADVVLGYALQSPFQDTPRLRWAGLYSIDGGKAWRIERPLAFEDIPRFMASSLRWMPRLNPPPAGHPWGIFLPDPTPPPDQPYHGLLLLYFPVDGAAENPSTSPDRRGEAADPMP